MRFMHMADVHLGASPDGRSDWSEARKKEIWETFRSSIEDAGREQVDLLLIAGDLFHRQPLEAELREVNYLFSTLTNTRVVLIAGNHDYLHPASAYLDFSWSRNVAGLFSPVCECVRFPEIKTEVYGFSYDRQEIQRPLYDELRPEKNEYFHILLAHGGDSRHIPFDQKKLARSGFDYIALGHIHKPQELVPDRIVFSGALEPIDCNDTGAHGYVLGEVEHGKIHTRFVKKAKREYMTLVLETAEGDTTYSLRDRLEQEIQSRGWQHIYRVILQGKREAGSYFDTDKLMEFGMVLEVKDQTAPAFHLEELKQQYYGQLIGNYIESFEGHERSRTEEMALQYGLEALLASRK